MHCQLPLLNLGTKTVRLHPEAWYRLPILGGSDSYVVRVEPEDLATVFGKEIMAKKLGKGRIVVRDRLAPDNELIIELNVLSVGRLWPLEEQIEMEKEGEVVTYLCADAIDGKPFTNSSISF